MKEVLIATNNAHKVKEIRAALNFEGWTFTTLAEAGVTSDPAEDADSFEGKRLKVAEEGIAELQKNVDSLIVILNDKLMEVMGDDADVDVGLPMQTMPTHPQDEPEAQTGGNTQDAPTVERTSEGDLWQTVVQELLQNDAVVALARQLAP